VFAVVLCGPAPQTASGATAPIVFPSPDAPAFLDVAADVLPALVDDIGTVLLLHRHTGLATARARMARRLVSSSRVLPVSLSLPVTGVVAVAEVLAALAACDVPAGAVVSDPSLVLRHIVSVGTTPTVTRLSSGRVSLVQHVASYVPGTSFTVHFAPEHRVVGGSPRPVPARVPQPWRVISAGDEKAVARLLGAVLPDFHDQPAHVGDVDTAAMWGSRRAGEVAVAPLSIGPVVDAVLAEPAGRCRACDDRTRQGRCVFCSSMEVL
jgi:hypothetical protein